MSAAFEGYLSLTIPGVGCVEVIDQCRTMNYLKYAATGGLKPTGSCQECCCSTLDQGYGQSPAEGPNPAPWYDPVHPESDEFLGLSGDLTVGLVQTNTGVTRKRLTFVGTLLSSCDGGRVFGYQWLNRLLESDCLGCRDLSGTLFTHCNPDADLDAPMLSFPNPRPSRDGDGYYCCNKGEPERLGESPTPDVFIDSGARTIPQLRYVRGSFQTISDIEWPACYGCRVTFSFDVEAESLALDPIPVCVMDVDVFTDLDPCCDCHDLVFVDDDTDADCGRCGRDCYCYPTPPAGDACSVPASYTDDNLALCRYSTPLCGARRTCVTPPTPFDEAVPYITIYSGDTDVDVLVSMWEALPGLPDPGSCAGRDAYNGRPTVGAPVGLHIPAGSTMILDGRNDRIMVECNGRLSPAGSLAETCDGTRPTFPTICCQRRLWVAYDVDCYCPPSPGFKTSVSMVGLDRI